MALSLPIIVIPLVTTPLMKAIGERRSTRSFVAQLAPRLTSTVMIVGVEAFTGSMAFYLRRPLIVASDDAEELTSNYITRHYGHFSVLQGSSLKPTAWLHGTIDACCSERLYIVRNNDEANRALFTSRGLSPIATGPHHVAYGRVVGHE